MFKKLFNLKRQQAETTAFQWNPAFAPEQQPARTAQAGRVHPHGSFPKGVVSGKHYTEWMETAQEMKRSNDLDGAIQVLRSCADATEDEAVREGWTPAPAYFEHLAICFRKQGDLDSEVAVLERYLSQTPNGASEKLVERLGKATQLRAKAQA